MQLRSVDAERLAVYNAVYRLRATPRWLMDGNCAIQLTDDGAASDNLKLLRADPPQFVLILENTITAHKCISTLASHRTCLIKQEAQLSQR